LKSKYPPQHHVFKYSGSIFFHNKRSQVSHQYK
jgi:hypothetical protein